MQYPHSTGIVGLPNLADGGYIPMYAYGGPIPKYGLGSWLGRQWKGWLGKGVGALLDVGKYGALAIPGIGIPTAAAIAAASAGLKKGLVGSDVGLFDWKLGEGEEIGGEGWKNAALEGLKTGAFTYLGGKALQGAHRGAPWVGTPGAKEALAYSGSDPVKLALQKSLGSTLGDPTVLGGLRSLTSSEGLKGLAGELTKPEHRFFTLPGISEISRVQELEKWKDQMEEGGGAFGFGPPNQQYQMATQQAHDRFNQQFGQGQAPGPGSLYTYRRPELPEVTALRNLGRGADGGYIGGYQGGGYLNERGEWVSSVTPRGQSQYASLDSRPTSSEPTWAERSRAMAEKRKADADAYRASLLESGGELRWNEVAPGVPLSESQQAAKDAQQARAEAGGYENEEGEWVSTRVEPTDWLKGEFKKQNPDSDASDADIIRWAATTGTPNTETGWEGGPEAGVGPDQDSSRVGTRNIRKDIDTGRLDLYHPQGKHGSFEYDYGSPLDNPEMEDKGDEAEGMYPTPGVTTPTGTITGPDDPQIPGPYGPGWPGGPPLPPLAPPPPPPGPAGPGPTPVAGTGRTPMAIHSEYRPGFMGEYQYFKPEGDPTTKEDVMRDLGVGGWREGSPESIGVHPEDVTAPWAGMGQEDKDKWLADLQSDAPMYTLPKDELKNPIPIVSPTNLGNPVIPESADGGPIDPRMAAMAPPGMAPSAMAPPGMGPMPQGEGVRGSLSQGEMVMALEELAKAISAGDDATLDMMFEYFGPETFQQLINILMGEQRADADGFATNGGLLDDKGAGPRADDLLASVNGDPILLSGDEFVVNADATQKIGPDNLQRMMNAANAGQPIDQRWI